MSNLNKLDILCRNLKAITDVKEKVSTKYTGCAHNPDIDGWCHKCGTQTYRFLKSPANAIISHAGRGENER